MINQSITYLCDTVKALIETHMISVITGDIINSKRTVPEGWLKVLKKELSKLGTTPRNWEIFRGDSFQVEVKVPADALAVAIRIKTAVKTMKKVNVRMAIGIGDKTYNAKSVTESNGSAFVHSGQLAEELKKLNQNLAVRSDNAIFDREMNLYLRLALIFMDSWTSNAAQTILAALQNPDKSQEALGKLLGIKQNAVSTRLRRAHYYEVIDLIDMYQTKTAGLK